MISRFIRSSISGLILMTSTVLPNSCCKSSLICTRLNKEGIFKLVGDKQPSDIEIPDEIINIEEELDIETLDDIEEFDFSL